MLSFARRLALVAAGFLVLAPAGRALLDTGLQKEMDAAIGKRVSRDREGRFYVLTVGPDASGRRSIHLRRGPAAANELSDFSPPIGTVMSLGSGVAIGAAGMAIDAHDRLHLIWTTASGRSAYAVCDLAKRSTSGEPACTNPLTGAPGAMTLAPAGSHVGDIALDSAGEAWIAWAVVKPDHQATLYLGHGAGSKWSSMAAGSGYGLAPPTLSFDVSGGTHLGWHDIYENGWVLNTTGASLRNSPLPRAEPIPRQGGGMAGGYRPMSAPTPAGSLIVWENQYNQIAYLPPDAKNRQLLNLTSSDRRFAWDTLHSPRFFTDRFGIPWLFFIDSARQHVFYSRWLGTAWSEFDDAGRLTWNSSRFEDNHLPIDRLSVEERTGGDGRDVGILLENESTTPTARFIRIPVPQLRADPGRKILFLDLKEIARLDGVELACNQPRKVGQVVGQGGPGDFDADRVGRFVRVLKEKGVYRMWYVAMKLDPQTPWWTWDRMGYAESSDGLTFHRVNLGLAAFNGKSTTNMVPGLAGTMADICYDPSDPDPQRRYKALDLPNTGIQDMEAEAGRQDPWDGGGLRGRLLVSPDGLRWTALPARIDFPAGRPGELIPESLFFDPTETNPAKRYKFYGFSSLNLRRRGGGYAYSPDAIHWTADPDNPVLDPFAGDTPPVRGGMVDQIHDLMAWRDGGYYLALYQYQKDGANLDLRLAVSRDGEHFDFVRPGEVFLPAGGPKDWDQGMLTPAVPVADGDEMKIYYGATYYAQVSRHGDEAPAVAKSYGNLGVAVLRRDGFTDLQPKAGRTTGNLETIPIDPGSASAVTMNGDCGSGSMTVALIDSVTGKAVPGFAAADCIPLTGNFVSRTVKWKTAAGIDTLRSPFRIRVDFSNSRQPAKLYSIGFR